MPYGEANFSDVEGGFVTPHCLTDHSSPALHRIHPTESGKSEGPSQKKMMGAVLNINE